MMFGEVTLTSVPAPKKLKNIYMQLLFEIIKNVANNIKKLSSQIFLISSIVFGFFKSADNDDFDLC